MNRLIISSLFLFGLSTFFLGCIDQINFDIDTDERKIFIDGFIADSLNEYSINLSRSSEIGVGTDNLYEPIIGAAVSVIDDQGNMFKFLENTDGVYSQTMKGETGASYFVEAILPDGKTIRSKPQILPEKVEIGEANFKPSIRESVNTLGNFVSQDILDLSINTNLNQTESNVFLRYRVSGEYEFHELYPMALSTKWCYVKESLDFNNIQIVDSREIEGDQLTNFKVIETALNYRFAVMYCFHVSQISMTEEEYNYWKNISDIINRDGSLFDPPPGTVRGNLYNPDDMDELILGYFSVSAIDRKRFFTNTDMLQFYIDQKCSSIFARPQYAECRDCLRIFNSTLSKPSYWIP